MKQSARIVLLVILLAALPLRGYADVLTALCEGHHGGNTIALEHAHEHGDRHHHEHSDDGAGSPVQEASVCSLCASCCAGAGLASPLIRMVAFQSPGTHRIPFLDRQVSGFVPEHFERPPLAL